MNKSQKSILHELADCYGVQTSYYDVFHVKKHTSDHSLLSVLKSLRVPVETERDLSSALHEFYKTYWQRKIEPVLVAWEGNLTTIPLRLTQQEAYRTLRCRLVFEDGQETSWDIDLSTLPTLNTSTFAGTDYLLKTFAITHPLPSGYHRLFIQTHKKQLDTLIISAPLHAYRHATKTQKSFGLFTPLYALHSQRSIGCGDLTDFKNLISWTSQQGGNFVSTTPLHAAFLDVLGEFSPYSPVSRLFWNELYLDITAIPEFAGEILPGEVAKLNANNLVDYQKIMALKRRLLERMCQKFSANNTRRIAFENYLTHHPEAKDYAAFRATCELHKQPWSQWPEAQRHGKLPAQIFNDPSYHYHLYVQWQIHEQLGEVVKHAKAASTLLYLDTPLGVHPHGYDTWRFQQDFPAGATAGAPPDGGFPLGQNWGIAPLHPTAMRTSHYKYVIQYLRTTMPHHDLLRLDHVMNLHRLYWIPENCEPQDGAYVHYPAEELYAILSLESHRNQVGLIGENLGTVPSYVNKMMHTHHVDPMFVLQYELDSNHPITKKISKNCVASLNTHDMPPFAAYLQGLDIQQRIKVGVLDKAAEETELKQRQARVENLLAVILSTSAPEEVSVNTGFVADCTNLKSGLLPSPACGRGAGVRVFQAGTTRDTLTPTPLPQAGEGNASFLDLRGSHTSNFFDNISQNGGQVTQDNNLQQIVFNTLIFLASQKVQYLLINLEDLWLETTQQNIPSLPADKSLNWQHKNRYPMEQFEKMSDITQVLSQVASARAAAKKTS